MVKIVIIPDIHNRYTIPEIIIDCENPDLTIFLGDYFDSFGEDHELVVNTAKWLQESTQKKDRIHLIGNHDIFYMTGSSYLMCSGNSEFKRWLINSYMKNWDALCTYAWAGDWLCTHAGLTKPIYDAIISDLKSIPDYGLLNITGVLDEIGSKVKKDKNGRVHPVLSLVGRGRGGNSDHGGILWCHYDNNPKYTEFIPITGVNQVFGHTASQKPRGLRSPKHSHINLDTFGEYYAVLNTDNNKMQIRNVNKIGATVEKK